MTTASTAEIAEVLGAASAVTILCHVRPDADTIGSGLALGLALHARGLDVEVAFPGPESLPVALRGLPGARRLLVEPEAVKGHDVSVSVDAAGLDRLGGLATVFDGAATSVVIDHHASNRGFGDLDFVDAQADCTAVLVLRILDELGSPLDADIATCLYAGLATDTGSFKWARPDSFRIAARLLDSGVDGRTWSRTLFDTHPFSWLSMVSGVLGSAMLVREAADGAGLVYAVVDHDAMSGMSWEESESIIDIVRTTADAEIAAVFKEIEPSNWTVSLRSKESVDLIPIARALGGGGHRHASGYSDTGAAAEVVARLVGSL
ncbi:DHH family phosphoesterase [Gordonia otitidis]|uniref:Phosphoesterase n=1 Tax=Gordonia otitidis (strain DSM 44809 / CCUG 52243 / JCM 12355 / NBRC 100426 / IFM 10032) TaxID=1108044 RepID=H5TK71_GORO1|nr:bifunctional oligoribonuclease/PAP phosphatase NrnA [Gordonia otitidis]GAB33879.1 putative phosphoesterase [Gordonia otitidis NBRC 100426]